MFCCSRTTLAVLGGFRAFSDGMILSRSLSRRHPSPPTISSLLCSSLSSSFANEIENDNNTDLSVGIFIDLDNVAPKEYTRASASRFVDPLKQFAEQTLDGKLERFHGWGNENTHNYKGGTNKRKSRVDADQDEETFLESIHFEPWDGNTAVTGYDANGILRCGVCGHKIKLTKKDRKAGRTEQDKLARHMKELHAREQQKRLKRRQKPSGKKLPPKEFEKFKKYKSGVVGVLPQSRVANDLFQVLREKGLRCKLVKDVDESLQLAARRWMGEVGHDGRRAALMVVSKDADFVPLLRLAREKNMLSVTASPDNAIQTKALLQESDIVLEAREEDDEENPYVYDLDKDEDDSDDLLSVDAVYKMTARTDKGHEALRRGYIKKISDSL